MKKIFFSIILCLILCITGNGWAATFTVTSTSDSDCSDFNCNLQSALNAAGINVQSDTINISGESYVISQTYIYTGENYELTIAGAGVGLTTLDGNDNYQIMNINVTGFGDDSSAHITIQDITFQNGNETSIAGGGLFVQTNSANITVWNSEFQDNVLATGHDRGGGLYAETVSGNITVTDSFFSNNYATDDGGGAYAQSVSGSITITGNTFSLNHADEGGGGIGAESDNGGVTFDQNIVTDNTSNNDAGGARLRSDIDGTVIVSDNNISNNSSSMIGGLSAYTRNGQVTVIENTMLSNSSLSFAGGVLIFNGSGGGAYFVNNTVSENMAGTNGGGVYVLDYNPSGGCPSPAGDATLVLTNNTITDNSSITSGGGLYFEICENGSQIQVFNNIVWGNTSVGSGDDIFIDDDVGGDLIGASVTLSHNDYSDFIINRGDNLTQSGNINANPQLTADFHLMDGSLCINRGENNATSLPSTDYEGEARIQNGVVDIGADESPYSKSDGGGTSSSSSGGGGGCFIATMLATDPI